MADPDCTGHGFGLYPEPKDCMEDRKDVKTTAYETYKGDVPDDYDEVIETKYDLLNCPTAERGLFDREVIRQAKAVEDANVDKTDALIRKMLLGMGIDPDADEKVVRAMVSIPAAPTPPVMGRPGPGAAVPAMPTPASGFTLGSPGWSWDAGSSRPASSLGSYASSETGTDASDVNSAFIQLPEAYRELDGMDPAQIEDILARLDLEEQRGTSKAIDMDRDASSEVDDILDFSLYDEPEFVQESDILTPSDDGTGSMRTYTTRPPVEEELGIDIGAPEVPEPEPKKGLEFDVEYPQEAGKIVKNQKTLGTIKIYDEWGNLWANQQIPSSYLDAFADASRGRYDKLKELRKKIREAGPNSFLAKAAPVLVETARIIGGEVSWILAPPAHRVVQGFGTKAAKPKPRKKKVGFALRPRPGPGRSKAKSKRSPALSKIADQYAQMSSLWGMGYRSNDLRRKLQGAANKLYLAGHLSKAEQKRIKKLIK